MSLTKLPLRNLLRHRTRSVILLLLTALLAAVLAGGSVTVRSLQNGISAVENRMGADCVVTPGQAGSMVDLRQMVLDGVPGPYYMDKSIFATVREKAGDTIGEITSEYFLDTLETPYCSEPVHLIAFYPSSDFYVSPWVIQGTADASEAGTLVVGTAVDAAVGDTLSLYGTACRVVGKMEKTGRQMDRAIYASGDTIEQLRLAAVQQGRTDLAEHNPDEELSFLLVKAAPGYTVEDTNNAINRYVRKVKSTAVKSMISSITDGIAAADRMITGILAGAALASILVLAIVFRMSAGGRKREFAVLRIAGASRRQLSSLLRREALLVSGAGGLAGTILGLLLALPAGRGIQRLLALPYLLPSAGHLALSAVLAFALVLVIGPLVSSLAAGSLSRVDPGLVLREEN